MLNKQKGDMYGFITHTWNTVKGKCPHGCSYCYMKRFGEQAELHFDDKELETDLYDQKSEVRGQKSETDHRIPTTDHRHNRRDHQNFIFVGSSCDMWAKDIPAGWVVRTLNHCRKYSKNKYLFQTKDPIWILDFDVPEDSVIGTTIETNRAYPEMGKAPPIGERARALLAIKEYGFETMITIEPIMDFDFAELVNWIYEAKPDWVNIGADSQGHGLPEPSAGKIRALIEMLSWFTEVRQKPNLKRLLRI